MILGLAGIPGMKGTRGDTFMEKGLLNKIPGEKGPKGFSGKEGSIGWPG